MTDRKTRTCHQCKCGGRVQVSMVPSWTCKNPLAIDSAYNVELDSYSQKQNAKKTWFLSSVTFLSNHCHRNCFWAFYFNLIADYWAENQCIVCELTIWRTWSFKLKSYQSCERFKVCRLFCTNWQACCGCDQHDRFSEQWLKYHFWSRISSWSIGIEHVPESQCPSPSWNMSLGWSFWINSRFVSNSYLITSISLKNSILVPWKSHLMLWTNREPKRSPLPLNLANLLYKFAFTLIYFHEIYHLQA